jgi:predicted transcriptional regulator
LTQKRGRGRPAFKPTQLHRRKVEQYVCGGMSHDAIAKVLGVSDETLRKHFAAELSTGAERRRAEVIDLLFASARKGNVTAQKKLEEMSGRSVAEAAFTAPEAEDAKPAKVPKLGKKEVAAQDAETAGAGTAWGDDLQIGTGRTLN